MVDQQEVERLRQEARSEEFQPADNDGGPAADVLLADVGDGHALKTALAGAVGMAAKPLCARYRVTALRPDECRSIGEALYGVAEAYGLLDRADPKVVSLLMLGGVVMQVVSGRERLPDPPKEPVADAAAA